MKGERDRTICCEGMEGEGNGGRFSVQRRRQERETANEIELEEKSGWVRKVVVAGKAPTCRHPQIPRHQFLPPQVPEKPSATAQSIPTTRDDSQFRLFPWKLKLPRPTFTRKFYAAKIEKKKANRRGSKKTMTTLIRKAWELVSSRTFSSSESTSSSSSSSSPSPTPGSGGFDRLPTDLLMKIVRLVGPKEAAKLSVVCRAWRCVVSENELWIFFLQKQEEETYWESLVFSETHLRFGYPLQTFLGESPQLSYMGIYSQRVQVPGSAIIDGGSGYCKFGWSKYPCPSGQSATFLEFGNVESPMHSRLRHFFVTIYSRMQVKPSLQPVVLSIPICHYDDTESAKASRRQLKEAIYKVLFDMNVPAVCAINQATLALYAARRTSGIVVNIGFQVTSIVPILNGKVMRKVGVEVMGLGALRLTGFLRELLHRNNINFDSLYTVRTVKEKLCYVAEDYEAELSKNTQASFVCGGEECFTVSKERFQTGEILFQPQLAGLGTMSLHQAVALCMEHCHLAELTGDNAWFKTVVLSGGTACLPGLAGRLEKELHGVLPPFLSDGITVIPPPYGAETAWFGAKIISNLSTFPGPWCMTKKQFRYKSRIKLMW